MLVSSFTNSFIKVTCKINIRTKWSGFSKATMRGPTNDTETIKSMPRKATENACPHTSSQSDATSGKTGCSKIADAMMLNTVST